MGMPTIIFIYLRESCNMPVMEKIRATRLIKFFIYCVLAIAAVTLILPVIYNNIFPDFGDEIVCLNDGWSFERNEITAENMSRKDILLTPLRENEAIAISHVLSENGTASAFIEMELQAVSIRAYLDGGLIYHYGDTDRSDIFVRKTHYIPLNAGYGGKTLSITLMPGKNSELKEIPEIYMGNKADLFFAGLHRDGYSIFNGSLRVIYGFILIFAVSLMHEGNIGKLGRILNGLILISSGFKILLATSFIFLAIPAAEVSLTLEAALLIFTAVSVIALAVSSFNEILRLFGVGARSSAHDINKAASAVELMPVFMSIILLSGLFMDSFFSGIDRGGFFFSYIGALLYVGSLILNHNYYAAEYEGATVSNRRLTNAAFKDPLTGNSNRAHCEKLMYELEKENASYCIIMMDVNNLKKINDTMGHADGDRFLRGFAQILNIFYKNALLIGRMGGDEFVVILKNTDLETGAERAQALEAALHKINRGGGPFIYEASYGVAHSFEVRSGKAADVYNLADSRMYEMKNIVHKRKGAMREE